MGSVQFGFDIAAMISVVFAVIVFVVQSYADRSNSRREYVQKRKHEISIELEKRAVRLNELILEMSVYQKLKLRKDGDEFIINLLCQFSFLMSYCDNFLYVTCKNLLGDEDGKLIKNLVSKLNGWYEKQVDSFNKNKSFDLKGDGPVEFVSETISVLLKNDDNHIVPEIRGFWSSVKKVLRPGARSATHTQK